MKVSSRKKINSEKKWVKVNDSANSFLVETSFNSDVDLNIRKEIDLKFSKSKINSEYKFPRKIGHKKNTSKQLSTKTSFENLSKLLPSHKISKSSTNTLFTEIKPAEKSHLKKVNFLSNFASITKNKPKKEPSKPRHYSYRTTKTDRISKSKSPKHQKMISEAHTKNLIPMTSKRQSTECYNKIFSPYNSNTKLLNSIARMRLKKIYNTVKNSKLN